MKKTILAIAIGALTLGVNAGDWGKAPVYDKAPIEECIDLGGNISAGYHTDYIYKGYRLGRDTVSTHVDYTFANLAVPITVGVDYYNVINGNFVGTVTDNLQLFARADLGNHAGFDIQLSYTQNFYPELNNALGGPPNGNVLGSHGEIGLHVQRDLGFVTAKADVIYNLNAPQDFVGGVNAFGSNPADSGAWYYDFGLEKGIDIGPASLVLNAGIAYSDNYFGGFTAGAAGLPNQTGGRSSGWNHYYIRASLPIELNCRTTLTPYIGYNGAPDSFIQDGAPGGGQAGGTFAADPQSDILHGGISLNVAF